MTRWLLWLALLQFASGCGWEDGLDYDELHVSALRSDGVTPATSVPQDGCVTMPLLLGSRVEETITLADRIVVDVSATRDRAHVRVSATDYTDERTILAEDLRLSTFLESFPPIATQGETYTVQIDSNCPSTDAVPH